MFTYDDTALRAAASALEGAPEQFLMELKQKAEQEGQFLVERIQANVPYKTGALAGSLSHVVQEDRGNVNIELRAGVPYALAAHERPGGTDGSEPEGGRGPKFFMRVLDFHRQRLQDLLNRVAQQAVGR